MMGMMGDKPRRVRLTWCVLQDDEDYRSLFANHRGASLGVKTYMRNTDGEQWQWDIDPPKDFYANIGGFADSEEHAKLLAEAAWAKWLRNALSEVEGSDDEDE